MIVRNNKSFETNSIYPNIDWYNEGNYVVDETKEENQELITKIMEHAPYMDLVVKNKKLVDIIPYTPTLDEFRQSALDRIDGKCSAAIYSGVTVGDKHYKLTQTAQGNLATAQAKVDGGAESVIYAADDEEPTLHTAEQIRAISDAAYKWGVVNTSYYAKLKKWIARETDIDVLATIDYGVKLPDDLTQELGTLLSGVGINLADYAGLLNGGN